jgi:hypothetical protein
MSISSEIAQIIDNIVQGKAAIDMRDRMRIVYFRTVDLRAKLQFYQAGAGFDDIPAETKAALIRLYQMCVQLKDGFENDPAFSVLISETVEPEAPPPLP